MRSDMRSLVMLSAGSNARGQLATGMVVDAHQFTPCLFYGLPPGSLPADIAAVECIACGANHTLTLLRRLDRKTELWGCGDGRRGQLGPAYDDNVDGTDNPHAVFRQINLNLNTVSGISHEDYTVRLIAAGWETSYVVVSCPGRSDLILSMGADDFGNLGVGSSAASSDDRLHVVDLRSVFPHSPSVITVLSLAAGPHHTVAHLHLTHPSGQPTTVISGWGTSRHGQLGPICAPSGRPIPFSSSPHIVPIPAPENISTIALGNQHTVCRRTSGELSALGSDRKCQLRDLESLHDVAQIGCTWNGTYALLRTGVIVATGSNTHSQLARGADPASPNSLAPVLYPAALAAGLVSRIACGSEHVLCVGHFERDEGGAGAGRARREVWGWGWNEHGNLGTGDTNDAHTPVRVWPPPFAQGEASGRLYGDVVDVWAGCGTSWIVAEQPYEDS